MGIYVCTLKPVPSNYSQIVVTTYSILVAVIVLTPFVLPRLHAINISQLTYPPFGEESCIWVLYQQQVDFIWNRGLQMLNASSGGLFFFFQPWLGHYSDGLF